MCKAEVRIYEGGVVLCPGCLGHAVKKGGLLQGRQKYNCTSLGCGRAFVHRSPRQLVDDFIRQASRAAALKLADAGVPVAVISKSMGIPIRTIYHDIKLTCERG